MTYEQINNIFLLISTGAVAYLFYLIFQYAYEVSDRLPTKKNRKDELKALRTRKLKQSEFEYYYTMAINSPYELATNLANNHIQELKRENKINEMYSKLRAI